VFEVQREATLAALTVHDDLAPLIFDMAWTIGKAPVGHRFLTSDHPVAPHKFVGRNEMTSAGFKDPAVHVSFPLSSQHCWFGHWNKNLPSTMTIRPAAVHAVNCVSIAGAERFVFCPEPSPQIEGLVRKYRENRPRWRQVGLGPNQALNVVVKR